MIHKINRVQNKRLIWANNSTYLVTWEHLPYVAVLKSGHTTATVSSSIHTFFHGSKLLTVAVLWSVAITANPGSSMDTFLR